MALKRRKLKDSEGDFLDAPVKCYLCKEKKAFHTMHGGMIGHHKGYRGKTCCNDCYPAVQNVERELLANEDGHMSEADYQTWGRL